MALLILTLIQQEREGGISVQGPRLVNEVAETWIAVTENGNYLKYLTYKNNINKVSLTLKGKGKYIVNVYVNKDEDYYYYRFPIELNGNPKSFTFELKDGIQMGFGMPEFPGSKMPSKIIITPDENNSTEIQVLKTIIE